jgi:hypothetical protein
VVRYVGIDECDRSISDAGTKDKCANRQQMMREKHGNAVEISMQQGEFAKFENC